MTDEHDKVVPLRKAQLNSAQGTKTAPTWRILAGLGTALVVVVLVMVSQRGKVSEPTAPAAETAAAETPATAPADAIFVALLKAPESSLTWTLSFSNTRHRINVAARGDFPDLGNRRFRVWLLVNGDEPVALGVLPPRGGVSLKLPEDVTINEATELGLTLESPTDEPGPPQMVITTGVVAGA